MIEVYRYLHGIYKVDKIPLQMAHNTLTRGHSLKLKKERVTADNGGATLDTEWNSLTEDVVSAHTKCIKN